MEQEIDYLKEYKKKHRLTDSKISEATGYQRSYINAVLNGKVPVTANFTTKFYEAFPIIYQNTKRMAVVNRKTRETDINLELNVDGTGKWQIETGIKMFDHLLSQTMQHGRFDLKLTATGDDPHHLIEDIAMCLGRALTQALGEKQGIVRMASASVPMDDALSAIIIDISGRAYTVLDLTFTDNDMAGFPTDLIRHFLETFASEARLNLHGSIVYGTNDHHKAEALFKALGRALDKACQIDERIAGQTPSTKERLER